MSGELRTKASKVGRAVVNLAGARSNHVVDFDELRLQIGGLETRLTGSLPPGSIAEAEFSVFSQWGEDGIIQHLLRHVPIENDTFVEFGVEDYRESNTRFLLVHDNWRGLVLDGGEAHIEFLRASGLGWRHQIDAISAFIDRDNINSLITGAGIEGDIGLLSVDIDGNDCWVFDAIDVISPRIVITEYNSLFGPSAAIAVPYDSGFRRAEAHWSYLYWGASIAGLTTVADRKGYALVGSNRAGNNAFFVRRDVLGALPAVSPETAWVRSRFRESRDPGGSLSYVTSHEERLQLIGALPAVDVANGNFTTLAEAIGQNESRS